MILQDVFAGSVIMEPVDTAFEYATKQTSNNLKFPFISFYPNANIRLDNSNNSMDQYHTGAKMQNPIKVYDEDGSFKGENVRLVKNQNFLYIIIGYQLEIWGVDLLSVEQVTQELIFWLYRNQQVSVKLMNEELNFTFSIDDQIINNSDLTLYNTQGKLYRYTLSIELQGVLLETQNFFTALHPIIDIKVVKKEKKGE